MAQTSKHIRIAYNTKAYQAHKYQVRRYSDLNRRIVEYKQAGHSLNYLITKLLCDHFDEPFPHPELDVETGGLG